MAYNIQTGDTVKLDSTILKVLSAPKMDKYFEGKGETFGWVKCEVIEDHSGKYEVGFVDEFNGDFLIKT